MDFNTMMPKIQFPKIDSRKIEWPKFDFSDIRWFGMPKLKIGDLVAKLPIIQGGMGVGISLSGLASAVANEGGIGVIAANSIGMLDSDYYATHKDANVIALKKEIRKAKEKTSGVIGVNIMVSVYDFQALLRVSIEEKVDIVFLGAGLPIKEIPVEDLRSAGVKVAPIVSSARAANIIFRSWEKRYNDIPDAIVVEGPKAGGHLGFKTDQIDDPDYSLEQIFPEVIKVGKSFEERFHRSVPVIAAGGIFTGKDIYKFFKLGAGGVQMGTRFVATDECDADIRFKEAYISCRKEDIKIIKSPVGMPGRAIGNDFLEGVSSSQEKKKLKCTWRCLRSCNIKSAPYCISLALDNARKGLLEAGFAFAGSNAYRVDKIIAVKALLQELKKQYLSAEITWAGTLRGEYEKALEKLTALKEEYSLQLKSGYGSLKSEYGMNFEKTASTFREEFLQIIDKINLLKTEYLNTVDNANNLKDELKFLLEQYSIFSRLQTQKT